MTGPEADDTCDVCGKAFEPDAVAVAHDSRGWLDDAGRFRLRWRHDACNRARAAGQVVEGASLRF